MFFLPREHFTTPLIRLRLDSSPFLHLTLNPSHRFLHPTRTMPPPRAVARLVVGRAGFQAVRLGRASRGRAAFPSRSRSASIGTPVPWHPDCWLPAEWVTFCSYLCSDFILINSTETRRNRFDGPSLTGWTLTDQALLEVCFQPKSQRCLHPIYCFSIFCYSKPIDIAFT